MSHQKKLVFRSIKQVDGNKQQLDVDGKKKGERELLQMVPQPQSTDRGINMSFCKGTDKVL